MFKILVFLLFALPVAFSFTTAPVERECDCPSVSNIQKTGQSSGSISYAWDGVDAVTEYKVWYFRQEGQYTSDYFYTSDPAYNFSNLSAGHYTFYFTVVCGETSSSWIGLEDLVQQ